MSTDSDTKIVIHPNKRKPSDKLMQLINEAVDTGIKLKDQIQVIWEQGAKEGFSKEEIAEIVRPIARAKGLNKDQVYYLTHRPDMLEKAKRQYQDLKELRNIQIPEKPDSFYREIPVEEFSLEDLNKYDRLFLIKIINYLCNRNNSEARANDD